MLYDNRKQVETMTSRMKIYNGARMKIYNGDFVEPSCMSENNGNDE